MNFTEGFSETSEPANERKIADFLLPSAGRTDRTRASVADTQPLSFEDRNRIGIRYLEAETKKFKT